MKLIRMESNSESGTKNKKYNICTKMKTADLTKEQLFDQINDLQEKINSLEKAAAPQSQSEADLGISENNLAVILERNADGILIVDNSGKVLYANLAAENLFGKSKADFLNFPLGFPVSKNKLIDTLTIRKGNLLIEVELRIVKVIWHNRPAFQLSVRDITERIRAKEIIQAAQSETFLLLEAANKSRRDLQSAVEDEKQAQQEIKELNVELEQRVIQRTAQLESINKELEAFSYSVSHDLKAPLRAIIGFSQILKEDYATQLEQEAKEYIGLIIDNAENMGKLINDLLNFSRMGRKALQKKQVDIKAIAERVKNELQAGMQDRKLTIKIQPMPLINADETLIYQVMLNLVSNAVKFTAIDTNSLVEIGCFQQNNENVFYVKDNGIGFDMKYAEEIFAVFQRLHSAEEFQGTGIGLAIVQRIIQKHGGKIWAESKKNKGSTFFFKI